MQSDERDIPYRETKIDTGIVNDTDKHRYRDRSFFLLILLKVFSRYSIVLTCIPGSAFLPTKVNWLRLSFPRVDPGTKLPLSLIILGPVLRIH